MYFLVCSRIYDIIIRIYDIIICTGEKMPCIFYFCASLDFLYLGVATSTSLVAKSATDAEPHVPTMAAPRHLVLVAKWEVEVEDQQQQPKALPNQASR